MKLINFIYIATFYQVIMFIVTLIAFWSRGKLKERFAGAVWSNIYILCTVLMLGCIIIGVN